MFQPNGSKWFHIIMLAWAKPFKKGRGGQHVSSCVIIDHEQIHPRGKVSGWLNAAKLAITMSFNRRRLQSVKFTQT